MRIPPSIDRLLRSNQDFYSWAMQCVSAVEGLIKSNNMVFFPEYTDHGVDHVELTLQTSIDMATDDAKNILTEADAAALIVSVALHDVGMYLTRDGFKSLISHDSRWRAIDGFGDKPWEELWTEFLEEAKRFDERKLKSLFGPNYRPVRGLPSFESAWEEFDFLLVGEFLRRHHPRLAHEIALYGFPSIDGQSFSVCDSSNTDRQFLSDISGLIARSHGMDLRKCFPYLEEKYNNKINPRKVHVAFLATLLRISDYFQIQANRAPAYRTSVVNLRSQLSAREWKVHQSVVDIHNTSSDPEAISVIASPADVDTFLKLRDWLSGVQSELDRSWAIIGEIFGLYQHNDLDKLGIKIRRVKSNLDNIENFSKTVNYFPERLSFTTSNVDLLKLLVGPLYSNEVGVGLREMIQNAVDAVREIQELADLGEKLSKNSFYRQDVDVLVEIVFDKSRRPQQIIITDKGVGMTFETVRDYFLKAGASFRQSDSWKALYADQEGKSRIFRTGRFGVGALAAFLLGNEIKVVTRHVRSSSDQAISFTGRLDDDTISVERTSAPIGTKIVISELSQNREMKDLVPFEHEDSISRHRPYAHYFLRSPSLAMKVTSKKKLLSADMFLPQPSDEHDKDWRCISTDAFEKIFWTHSYEFPFLSCNGIVISHGAPYGLKAIKMPIRYIETPRISVFDKDGNLALNLQRNEIATKSYPFENELVESIIDDLIAYAIVFGPENCNSDWLLRGYDGLVNVERITSAAHWAITADGFILNDLHLISSYAPKHIILAFGGGEVGFRNWADRLRSRLGGNYVIILADKENLRGSNPRIKGLFSGVFEINEVVRNQLGLIEFNAIATYISERVIEGVEKLHPGRKLKDKLEFTKSLENTNGWVCLRHSRLSSADKEIDAAIKELDPEDSMMFCVLETLQLSAADSWNLSTKRWLKSSKEAVIPFDLVSRNALSAQIAGECKNFIEIYKSEVSSNESS